MGILKKKKDDPEHWVHPSVDQTNRFPVDKVLRDAGFRIKERKHHREPIWEKWDAFRGWYSLPQTEAVKDKDVDWAALRDAEKTDELRYENLG